MMEISEEPKTKYYVQFYSIKDCKWITLHKYQYYFDAVIYLGQVMKSSPKEDHRVLKVNSETAIEVPSIDKELME